MSASPPTLTKPRALTPDGKNATPPLICSFEELGRGDVALVGGKCANLGELVSMGVAVPRGFAVTSAAYRRFLEASGLDKKIAAIIASLPRARDPAAYESASRQIQKLIEAAPMPEVVEEAIHAAYRLLGQRLAEHEPRVAVRSSATSEDLPDASFAGQQDTFLNVARANRVVHFVRECWASLFTPRAIFYRAEKGFEDGQVQIAVAVQRMVEARSSGVLFTMDPVTGDRSRIVIEATWGLGEGVVGGRVRPDRFVVDRRNLRVLERDVASKTVQWSANGNGELTSETPVEAAQRDAPSLTDSEIRRLVETALKIEKGYGTPQDIEFAVAGSAKDSDVWILQARPETVHSRPTEAKNAKNSTNPDDSEEPVLKGLAASPGIRAGRAAVVQTTEEASKSVQDGDILVTRMTNPDWVPYMKIASAIVTDDGGVTCHAAIVSREMGIPCIVGARTATKTLVSGREYTVDAKSGVVYAGRHENLLAAPAPAPTHPAILPVTSTKVYVNLSLPEIASKVARETHADGVGLLRAEHLMLSVGKHPRLLIEEGGSQRMVDAFADGIRKVATPFLPKPVVYRFLDFKPDEFLGLPGGEKYEQEAGHVGPNPLIGYRGCFRYLKEPDIFRLECQAIRKVREQHGLTNVHVMLPFVRTVDELRHAKRIMEEEGLHRGPDFRLWIMVEVPSTVLLIDRFIEAGLDGVSFGTNDLTMLLLGIDRDDVSVQEIYDERNLAVQRALSHVIRACSAHGVTTSVCGQAPSNYPELVEFLVREGVTSMSVNVDKVIDTKLLVAALERKVILDATRQVRADHSSPTSLQPGWAK